MPRTSTVEHLECKTFRTIAMHRAKYSEATSAEGKRRDFLEVKWRKLRQKWEAGGKLHIVFAPRPGPCLSSFRRPSGSGRYYCVHAANCGLPVSWLGRRRGRRGAMLGCGITVGILRTAVIFLRNSHSASPNIVAPVIVLVPNPNPGFRVLGNL